jgi:hypothetical protein
MVGIVTILKDLRRPKKSTNVLVALDMGEIGLQVFYN